MRPGDVVSVVGTTGSGKSRLLADIECLAQGDTPTGRKILINNCIPESEQRFSAEHKLVAQLSQNMNFVVDLTVREFVTLHAESRMIPDTGEMVDKIIACANTLAGERIQYDIPITQLSGGQSRALMISDTALLSPLPVVVIDEIENAGVDRRKALDLLITGDKIVLISTHDPILALMADMRIVIKNGRIDSVIKTTLREAQNLTFFQDIDNLMSETRRQIRMGEIIDCDIKEYLDNFRSIGQFRL
ncbi:MAG TPA: ATP-binding cassette domain-containing protein [Dissulfurispiraceae bacterium]|nr:ATP-binding cassette domain-containing protein [Dissulfurispiraceae bacterium]